MRLVVALLVVAASVSAQDVDSPGAFFGFRMGTDTRLASWPQIRAYFERVAAVSDRVELVDAGPTTDGNRLVGAIVSSSANIARLDAIKAANRRLADPRTLPQADADALIAAHKAVLVIGAGIHASEIGGTQAANELLHILATTDDPTLLRALDEVVVILLPSLNPDGHLLVVDWYERHKGTAFEGAPMPWLYHRYVGHDLNRDAFMLNMTESRSLAHFFYREWHPQVFLTMHQMGMRGPRFFVPPNYDPIDANYDPLLWRTAGLLGHAMALRLEQDGRSGVIQSAMYDYYWPGYEDSAPLGHNTVCLLTEAASVRIASPVYVAAGELQGSPRGLPDYRPQVNFPNPWPGGLWSLRDIVEYDLSAALGLIQAVARYRDDIVRNFHAMGQRALERGTAGGPFAFLIPTAQHDPHATAKLESLLMEAAVEIHRATGPFTAAGRAWPPGTDIVLMAQPFRAYAKTLLERQHYPVRRPSPGANAERPYDVAGWTLPYQMGIDVIEVADPFSLPPMEQLQDARILPSPVAGHPRPTYYSVDARGNGGSIAINRLLAASLPVSWRTDGTLVVPSSRRAGAAVTDVARELGLTVTGVRGRLPDGLMPISRARVGLYRPWVESIDEGWTRWLLERYEFPYTTVTNHDVRHGALATRFDVIVLPDITAEGLLTGYRPGTLPDEYTGGIGAAGVEALRTFVEEGGTLVALDSSTALAIDALKIPVRNVVRDAAPSDFFCPGSILRLEAETSHPLAFGMQPRTAAFFAYSSAFEVTGPPTVTNGGAERAPTIEVVARYGASDLLMSGWIEGPGAIAGRAAVIAARVGRGRAVLIGFRAQHRAQTHATFRLLFNAIHTSGR